MFKGFKISNSFPKQSCSYSYNCSFSLFFLLKWLPVLGIDLKAVYLETYLLQKC